MTDDGSDYDARTVTRLTRATAKQSLAWADVLAGSAQPRSVETLSRVHMEVVAFVHHLARLRARERCLRSVGTAFARQLLTEACGLWWARGGGADIAAASGVASVVTTRSLEPMLWSVQPVAARAASGVTREHFEAFCRLTGMDPEMVWGADAQGAGLVFYVVIYSLVNAEGGLDRVEANRLLHKLKACREDLETHVDRLFAAAPGAPESAVKALHAWEASAPVPASTAGDDSARSQPGSG